MLDGAGRSGAVSQGCRRGDIAEPRPSTGGRVGCADRSSRRPGPQPASPRDRLPDGGRFLLSRLTARLNIAAGARGRKEEQAGGAAAELEEGEEEQAEEGRSRVSAAPARPAPARRAPHHTPRGALSEPCPPTLRGPPRSRPGCQDGSGWSQETSKRRHGPVLGMHRALPERARAAQDLGTLPGRFARPGAPRRSRASGRCRSGPRPSGSVHPSLPPAPCSPRNGHGAAGVPRFWASRAFAERRGPGVTGEFTDREAKGSRFCKTRARPKAFSSLPPACRIPALRDLPAPRLRGRWPFPLRRTPVGASPGSWPHYPRAERAEPPRVGALCPRP